METEYWQKKWQSNDIAFHQHDFHPFLVNHFETLALAEKARVFVPLCGKTLDMVWLMSKGYQVIGVELVESAIVQLFDELNITPSIGIEGNLKRYSGPNIDVFVGDIFALTTDLTGTIDAVYDRAALVALPADMRTQYSSFITALTNRAPQLLICFDYDQSLLAGPPFSVNAVEVHEHYQQQYSISLIDNREVEGGLKGQCPAIESLWLLTHKDDDLPS